MAVQSRRGNRAEKAAPNAHSADKHILHMFMSMAGEVNSNYRSRNVYILVADNFAAFAEKSSI